MSDIKSETAFRTISEVAEELGVQQHVLRFWETKFSQIKPMKRGGGRRYYRPEDVAMVKKIHSLLYVEGYTIKGVQKLLKGTSKSQVLAEQKTVQKSEETQEKAVVEKQPVEAHGANLPNIRAPYRRATGVSAGAIKVEELQDVLAELIAMREEVRKLIDGEGADDSSRVA